MLFGIRSGDSLLGLSVPVLMSQFSISSLNDWADRDLDAAAGRWRPVALRRILPGVALGLALLFAICAIPGALAFGATASLFFFLGLAAGWAYDLGLKRTPLSFLPFAVAFPLLPVWVGLVAGRGLPGLLTFFLVGAPLAIAIHLADSIPDLGSDAASGVRSLAVALGPTRSVLLMQATLLLGSLVAVASFVHKLPVAILLGLTAVSGAVLARRAAGGYPAAARWVVSVTALAIAVAWLAVPR
jgi:4-hydroxybenzoate polyprenyltransferase